MTKWWIFYEEKWLGLGLSTPRYNTHELAGQVPEQPFIVTGEVGGAEAARQYLVGYVVEKSLAMDNIFVIALIFSFFAVPAKYQHRVLFWGILGAIVFRLIMLGGGAYLAHRFAWIFYIFGAYLVFQGFKMFKHDDDGEEDTNKSFAVRVLRKFVRIQDGDFGGKFTVQIDGRRALTTVAVCLISIELTDIVFALDSIPAIFGLTKDAYIVFTANAFALLGLRQLYFLLDGLLARLVYLKYGLGLILGFIGVKLVLEALHTNTLPFVNHGRPVAVWQIGIELSLGVIVGVLVVTTVASLLRTRLRGGVPV